MTSATAPVCPYCGHVENKPGATICSICQNPLDGGSSSPFGPVPTPPVDPAAAPASAAAYPPPPPPSSPPAPKAAPSGRGAPVVAPIFGGRVTGGVTKVEMDAGRPPADLAPWLMTAALVVGFLPLITANTPALLYMGAGIAVVIALIGIWRALRAGRPARLLHLTIDSPAQGQVRALMVDPTGQPGAGDTVEVTGRFIASRVFYTDRLRVVAADSSEAGAPSALARGGVTYTGRRRGSLWAPLLALLFCAFFWLAFVMIVNTFLSQYLPH